MKRAVLRLLPGILALAAPGFLPATDAGSAAAQDEALRAAAQALRLVDIPRFTARDCAMAAAGKQLFFDTRLSSNGRVSCATCHLPERSFTDGKAVASGLGRTNRNAPTLVNAFRLQWMFWDGRADSLVAQAVQPLESPVEHGSDRVALYRLMRSAYRETYEALFGPFPVEIEALLPEQAAPEKGRVDLPADILDYGLATLGDLGYFSRIAARAGELGMQPGAYLIEHVINAPADGSVAERNHAYQSLAPEVRGTLDRVLVHALQLVAAFERGLVANDSPFDRFVARWRYGHKPREAYVEGFGEPEFNGMRLFLGRGRCVLCHSGPTLTDGQFHNIGLPANGDGADYGRILGMRRLRADPMNCNAPMMQVVPGLGDSEACRESAFLDTENLEMVGAFKTPTLRNIAQTAPYMHDGRIASLEAVLDHYNTLSAVPAIGHREETVQPLGFNDREMAELLAFLDSLSSTVRELGSEPGCGEH